jgi:hypothetical protein
MTVSNDLAVALRGVAAMVSLEDKAIKQALNLESRRNLLPYMKGTLSSSAPNALARRVARTATVQSSRGFPYLKVTGKLGAKHTKKVNVAAAVEFGAVGQVFIEYKRKGHKVVRRTTAQFRPQKSAGKWIYPAAERMAPAVAAAWLTIVEDYYAAQGAETRG